MQIKYVQKLNVDHFDEDVERKMQVCIYGLHKKIKIMV